MGPRRRPAEEGRTVREAGDRNHRQAAALERGRVRLLGSRTDESKEEKEKSLVREARRSLFCPRGALRIVPGAGWAGAGVSARSPARTAVHTSGARGAEPAGTENGQ